jgi:hypothetical protein
MRQFAKRNDQRTITSAAGLTRPLAPPRAIAVADSQAISCSGTDLSRVPLTSGSSLPRPLQHGLETLSRVDLSGVRVHRDSPEPAAWDALAFTQGRDIHLGPGAEHHLPHEAWHAAQQLSGRVPRVDRRGINDDPALEAEADRMGARAAAIPHTAAPPPPFPARNPASPLPIQRLVRTGGGKTKIKDDDYTKGAKKAVGSRALVKDLIADAVPRAFTDETELESYANGTTDYIGDVKTAGANGTYWYRLPQDKLTVLGEEHHSPDGNAEDVIVGFRTKRFKYEAFNETVEVAGLKTPGTEARIGQINKQYIAAAQVDPAGKYKPELENAVFKAMTGANLARDFIAKDPPSMDALSQMEWGSRSSTSAYSGGERAALYLTLGMHIAKDLASDKLGGVKKGEAWVTGEAKALAAFYTSHQAELDDLMTRKDADDLLGIYELTQPKKFAVLPTVKGFATVMHDYGARYIERLGKDTGNKALEKEGGKLAKDKSTDLEAMNPAREEIMWSKIQDAKAGGYLLVGMGDRHRQNLTPRLDKDGIPHEFVPDSLERQKKAVAAAWTK